MYPHHTQSYGPSKFFPQVFEIDNENEETLFKPENYISVRLLYENQVRPKRFINEKKNQTIEYLPPDDGILWNYNSIYPSNIDVNLTDDEGFEQLFMEKHDVVLSKSLEDFYQKNHTFAHKRHLQDAFSFLNIFNSYELISEIKHNLKLDCQQIKTITQILYFDPDCCKVIYSILNMSPPDLKQLTLFLCVTIIIQGKHFGSFETHELREKIQSKINFFEKKYENQILECFEYDKSDQILKDFHCMLEKWMYTIFLAINGFFQNELFEQIMETEGKDRYLQETFDKISRKMEKRLYRKRKNSKKVILIKRKYIMKNRKNTK